MRHKNCINWFVHRFLETRVGIYTGANYWEKVNITFTYSTLVLGSYFFYVGAFSLIKEVNLWMLFVLHMFTELDGLHKQHFKLWYMLLLACAYITNVYLEIEIDFDELTIEFSCQKFKKKIELKRILWRRGMKK